MFYGKERYIKAHQDRNNPYYNHYYDRKVRDALCSQCGKVIGEQVKYSIYKHFSFDDREKNDYTHCPYCGHEFKR